MTGPTSTNGSPTGSSRRSATSPSTTTPSATSSSRRSRCDPSSARWTRRSVDAAAARLAAAGRRSLEADDASAAAALLGRAIDCLTDDDDIAELLVDRCEALLSGGDVSAAIPVIDRLRSQADADDRLQGWVACFAAEVANRTSTASLADTAAQAGEAADRLAALGDLAGEAKAHAVRADSLARLGRIGECEAALDLALGAARRAGDRRRATAVLAGAPVAALLGPNPVTRASGRCLDVVRVLRITSRAPAVEATSLRCQAVLESLRGRPEVGRRMLGAARRSLEELGNQAGLLEVDVAEGMVATLADDLDAAEGHLSRARDGLQGFGLDADAAFAAALLAGVLVARGRLDEALALTKESERLGGDDLRTAIAWRTVRADALVSQGRTDEATQVARAAVALAETTDALVDHAKAEFSLARALRAAGDEPDAEAHARQALELYQRKEATVFADEVRAFLGGHAEPSIVADAPGDRLPPPENAATRMEDRCNGLILAHDWDRLEECYAEDIVFSDRRPVMRTEIRGRAPHMENTKLVVELGVTSMEVEHLMVRGERLTLSHTRFGDKRGEHMVDALGLGELDDAGRIAVNAMYDHAQLAEAIQELEKRYLATDAVPHADQWRPVVELVARINARDWDGMRAVLHDDLEGMDHRQLGWGRFGADDLVGLYRSATDGAEDAWFGITEIHALTDDGACTRGAGFGTTDEGAHFRTSATIVLMVAAGKITRADYFSEADVDAGRAALGGDDEPAAPVLNTAVRTWVRLCELLPTGGPDAVRDALAESSASIDHRHLVGMELGAIGIEGHMRAILLVRELRVQRVTPTVVATRGDRLCLVQVRYAGPDDESVVDVLHVVEVDPDGRILNNDLFDVDDLDTAMVCLDRRTLEAQVPLEPLENGAFRAFARLCALGSANRWEESPSLLSEDVVSFDHRPLVGGLAIVGIRDNIAASQGLNAVGVTSISPTAFRAWGDRLSVSRVRYALPPEMGVESEALQLVETDGDGFIVRNDVFDLDQYAEVVAVVGERLMALGDT